MNLTHFFIDDPKMCCNVSVTQKAQPMPPAAKFPSGWKYVIDPTREGYLQRATALGLPMNGVYGLKFVSPTGREYYAGDKAKAHNFQALRDVSVDAFYEHIGVESNAMKPTKTKPAYGTANTTADQQQKQRQGARTSTPTRDQHVARSDSFLPKYRKVGSRVCCMVKQNEYWGILEEKHGEGPKDYLFTVRRRLHES